VTNIVRGDVKVEGKCRKRERIWVRDDKKEQK
jgi:hypothetical protein